MGFFRRRDETLNEQLLREAGLASEGTQAEVAEAPQTEPPTDPRQTVDRLFQRRGYVERPETSDATASAEDPSLRRDEYSFAVLPDGSLVVDDDCDEDLSRLADAIEQKLAPPYEAKATRQDERIWWIDANAVDIVDLPGEPGDNLTLACVGGELTFTRDGKAVPAGQAPRPLVDLGLDCGDDYVVEATRLDGTQFDATARPL